MDVVLLPLLQVIGTVLQLFSWALVISAVMSWLVAFNVINTRNAFVSTVLDVLDRVTEPFLRPLRRFIPPINGLDLTPIVLFLVIGFLQGVLNRLAMAALSGGL